MTVDDVLEAFQTSISAMSAENGILFYFFNCSYSLILGVGRDNWLAGNAAVARWYGLKMHGYEYEQRIFLPF